MGALLVSSFNMKWRCYAQAGDVEESKFCLFSLVFPVMCISSISPRFYFRKHAFCFLPLATILESSYFFLYFLFLFNFFKSSFFYCCCIHRTMPCSEFINVISHTVPALCFFLRFKKIIYLFFFFFNCCTGWGIYKGSYNVSNISYYFRCYQNWFFLGPKQ
jgi:hypothetical protein